MAGRRARDRVCSGGMRRLTFCLERGNHLEGEQDGHGEPRLDGVHRSYRSLAWK